MKKVFYSDGACSGNPGPGGYGVISVDMCYRQTMTEYIPSYCILYKYNEKCENTTNNREEMKAALHVMKLAAADPENEYLVYSDSAYVVNMCNNWIWNWAKNNWQNSKKKTVENLDLVQEIYSYLSKDFFNFQIKKVSGHTGIIENELADALATFNQEKFDTVVKTNHILENFDLQEKI